MNIHFEDFIQDAIELVDAWDIPESEWAEAVNAQAALLAGLNHLLEPGNDIPVTGKDLRSAVDAVLADEPVASDQTPSIGCNIKWAPGNEPDYFG